MQTLTKDQVTTILNNAPVGSDKTKILDGLIQRGYQLEGVDTNVAKQDIVKRTGVPISTDTSSVLDKTGKYLGDKIVEAAKSGVDTVKSGYEQAKNATNPLQLLEGSTKLAAGAIGTVFSPLAAPLAPLTEVIKAISDKIANSTTVQDFAKSKAGEITQRIVEDIANLNTIAGAVVGGKGSIEAKPTVMSDISALSGKIGDTGPGAFPFKAVVSKVSDITGKVVDTAQKVTGKVSDVTNEHFVPKALGIFTGENKPIIQTALKNPAVADLGVQSGDTALRQAVRAGSESSVKARTSFIKGQSEAVKEIVGNVKTPIGRQKILYNFVDELTKNGVKADKGNLDFSTSKISANPGEVSKINAAYTAIQNWKDFSIAGVHELKQLIGNYTKFANEAGGSSKSPFLGQFYHFLDSTIKETLPKAKATAYGQLNEKFSNNIDMFNEMVDAFNSGDPFTRLSQLFSNNKDSLRQVIDFYEKTTGNKIAPIVAGRELAMEKTSSTGAFSFVSPRAWIDFFIPPKTQASIVTKIGRLKGNK